MPMIIIGILFFIYGFFTWLNGTLIPYLKIACQLESDFESFLVATAFFIAYTVMAIPSSFVHRKIGYKKGMALGLIIMAFGSLLFIPAANARNFNMFLIGLFIIGTGLALLQTASNPYISLIGPIESAAKRISIMGIFNKCAGILAGLVFGYIALSRCRRHRSKTCCPGCSCQTRNASGTGESCYTSVYDNGSYTRGICYLHNAVLFTRTERRG